MPTQLGWLKVTTKVIAANVSPRNVATNGALRASAVDRYGLSVTSPVTRISVLHMSISLVSQPGLHASVQTAFARDFSTRPPFKTILPFKDLVNRYPNLQLPKPVVFTNKISEPTNTPSETSPVLVQVSGNEFTMHVDRFLFSLQHLGPLLSFYPGQYSKLRRSFEIALAMKDIELDRRPGMPWEGYAISLGRLPIALMQLSPDCLMDGLVTNPFSSGLGIEMMQFAVTAMAGDRLGLRATDEAVEWYKTVGLTVVNIPDAGDGLTPMMLTPRSSPALWSQTDALWKLKQLTNGQAPAVFDLSSDRFRHMLRLLAHLM